MVAKCSVKTKGFYYQMEKVENDARGPIPLMLLNYMLKND